MDVASGASLVVALIAMGIVPVELRWVISSAAGLLAVAIGWLRFRRSRSQATAFAVIGVGLALSFAVPAAPACGLIAFLFVRREAISRARTVRKRIWFASLGFAILSGAGVAVWALTAPPALRFYYLPEWASSGLTLWLVIVASAIANSAYEEVLWRLLLPCLIGGRTFLLSVGFGLAHLNSMPYGLSGVLLTAVFALTAHWMVRRSNGSIVPTIGAHIVADIVLLGMLLS